MDVVPLDLESRLEDLLEWETAIANPNWMVVETAVFPSEPCTDPQGCGPSAVRPTSTMTVRLAIGRASM